MISGRKAFSIQAPLDYPTNMTDYGGEFRFDFCAAVSPEPDSQPHRYRVRNDNVLNAPVF